MSLLFDEGYFTFQILRKQQLTVYKPYQFTSGVAVAAANTASGWETPTDAAGRRHLEPQEEETIYQFFTGLSPSFAKIYLQYTQRVDRMSLITPRTVPGVIGFWDGFNTLYEDPDPKTELWTLYQLYPYFNVENPDSAATIIQTSFWVTPFTYKVIKDKTRALKFLRKELPATIRTMGDGYRAIKAPAWLTSEYGDYLVQPEEV